MDDGGLSLRKDISERQEAGVISEDTAERHE